MLSMSIVQEKHKTRYPFVLEGKFELIFKTRLEAEETMNKISEVCE